MTDDDTVTITIPKGTAKWYATACVTPGLHSTVIVEACRVALWTPKVGDMVQTRSGPIWFPRKPLKGVKGWRRVVVDVTGRYVVTRDTDTGQLGAALIEDVRLDERSEPEGGWLTDWWDEHKAAYLDGGHE